MYNVHDFIWKDSSIDLSQPPSLTVSKQHWAVQLQVQLENGEILCGGDSRLKRCSILNVVKKIKHVVQIMHIVVFAFSAVLSANTKGI